MDNNLKYNSIDDLKPLYELNLKRCSADFLVKRHESRNWLEEIEKLVQSGKEEDAFIVAMKCLNVLTFISKSLNDSKYFKVMFSKSYLDLVSIAEPLKVKLEKRYEEKKRSDCERKMATLTNVETDERRNDEMKVVSDPYNIEAAELKKMIDEGDDSVFIMDVRNPEDFQMSHIKFKYIINIPEDICFRGCSASKIEQKLPSTAIGMWLNRHSFRVIIALDLSNDEPVLTLAKALRHYDAEDSSLNVRVLEDGLASFAELYPWLLTGPLPKRQSSAPSPFVDLSSKIDFPTFELEQDSAKPFFNRGLKPKPSEPSPVDVIRPSIDRGKKAAAVKKYEDKSELLKRQAEETNEALEVARKRNAKERELQEALALQKDRSEEQKALLEENECKLLMEIEELKNQSMSKDDTIKELQSALEEFKKKEDEVKIRGLEDRHSVSEEPAQKIEENKLEEDMLKKQEEMERLQRETDLLEKQQKAERKRIETASRKKIPERPKVPKIDRTTKPAEIFDDDVRDFNPVHGIVPPGLTGLKNIGNTCYMNSILQCISNNVEIAAYFCENHYQRDINRSHKTRGEVAKEVGAVVRALWSGQFRSVACKDFKATVGAFKSEYRTFEQQDSHEFLTFLMDWLHNDLRKNSWPEEPPHEPSEMEKVWEDFKSKNYSLIWKLFYGLQRSLVICTVCGETSTTYEPFSNLSLSIPDRSDVTLQDCIRLYLKEEWISGWRCPRCKEERRAEKRTELCKLPDILVIHLKRFSYLDIHSKKKTSFVDFPLENMELPCGSGERYKSYNLYAVSNHYGNMQGGHYTAYCKNCKLKVWHKFDDHEVVPLAGRDVKTSAAYILFYSAKPRES